MHPVHCSQQESAAAEKCQWLTDWQCFERFAIDVLACRHLPLIWWCKICILVTNVFLFLCALKKLYWLKTRAIMLWAVTGQPAQAFSVNVGRHTDGMIYLSSASSLDSSSNQLTHAFLLHPFVRRQHRIAIQLSPIISLILWSQLYV